MTTLREVVERASPELMAKGRGEWRVTVGEKQKPGRCRVNLFGEHELGSSKTIICAFVIVHSPLVTIHYLGK